jgi:hypothetical protein
MRSIIEHCSFEWMKKNDAKSVPLDGSFLNAWTEVFINTGVNGCWANALTAKEATEYGGACCGATGLQVCAGSQLEKNRDSMRALCAWRFSRPLDERNVWLQQAQHYPIAATQAIP